MQGETSLEQALARMKQATRNYAKRQLTWFRQEAGATWIDLSRVPEQAAADLIVKGYRSKVGRSKGKSEVGSRMSDKKGGTVQ